MYIFVKSLPLTTYFVRHLSLTPSLGDSFIASVYASLNQRFWYFSRGRGKVVRCPARLGVVLDCSLLADMLSEYETE